VSPRLQVLAAAALGCFGFWALASGTTFGSGFTEGFTPHFGVDGLTAFFLGLLGLVAAPTLAFASRYYPGTRRGRVNSILTGVFVLVLAEVLCARDPLTFLAGWELMTLLPAAIILVSRSDEEARRTVFLYLAITHLAGACTWVAVLLAANVGAFGSSGAVAPGSGLQIAIAIAALVGMGTKAGVMPMHSWLPRAHPIAPAPVSALMSGVMIKVAIYGLVRVLVDWLGPLPIWFGVLVLALGALSALGGVTYALFQHDLKRLLAFHSIENVGIIVLGLGACLLLRARGADTWAAIALAAALLHTLNHAVFKALLFLGAGSFERAAGSLGLDRLGGLLRRLPWTGGAFLVGALAIAGVPPLNGFSSEWVTLQAILHVPAAGHLGDGLAGALALAALAATAALAVLCFVKVTGLVLLGPPRSEAVASATERPLPMWAAVGVLAAACIVLGAAPGLLLGSLVSLAPWPAVLPTTIGLHLPSTGSLPTFGIATTLAVATGVLLLLRSHRAAAPAPTWACGQLVEPALGWTSAGFTKPLRLVLEGVLRPERTIVVHRSGGTVQEVSYSGRVPQLLEEQVLAPAVRIALGGAAQARRLQTGRLGTYAAYLIALVLVLLVAAKVGLIG
jgi:hydrogenase-4 component B